MKLNKLALVAILLWVASIAVFAWFFIRGNTIVGADNRTAVILGAGERTMVLSEMRGLLAGTHDIMEGINHNNLKQVAEAARKVGMASAADVNPVLMTKLPMTFKQLGMSVHHDMDDLALAAESGKPVSELQAMLTKTLSKCVSCHASWQINSEN